MEKETKLDANGIIAYALMVLILPLLVIYWLGVCITYIHGRVNALEYEIRNSSNPLEV